MSLIQASCKYMKQAGLIRAKIKLVRQLLVQTHSTKFHRNPLCSSWDEACGRTDWRRGTIWGDSPRCV